MANYKESTIAGTSYVRAKEMRIINELNGTKGVVVVEEVALNLPDGTVMKDYGGGIFEPFTAENATKTIAMLDANGDPTGATATYMDVYLILQSLYYHLAAQRDAANEQSNQP